MSLGRGDDRRLWSSRNKRKLCRAWRSSCHGSTGCLQMHPCAATRRRGFTITGGLEHGEPLIISRIEDGGKAAKCEKMEVGDELVNINGTPLYGSRQEALILIKGSYKILKMIVRRRNISVVRPHSWHLAKLSEVRPDVASMQYPADSFSMSWHSGCENSELNMQWNPLSRHCSTDKSSSIGSMESLDQPGQNYYEGTLSPIDPGMYQNKRDSAYSSFSASSNTSDYTVSARQDQSSPVNCILRSIKQEDNRYLQTGQAAAEPQEGFLNQTLVEHPKRPSSFPFETSHLDIKSPPQPPVRRDSLRASKSQLCHSERRRASAPGDTFHILGKWSLDSLQQNNTEPVQCQCTRGTCTLHLKDNLSSGQYYMLSSQTDRKHENTNSSLTGEDVHLNHCTDIKSRWPVGNDFNHNQQGSNVQKVKETLKNLLSVDQGTPLNSLQTETDNLKAAKNELEMASSADNHYPTDECVQTNGKDYKCSIKHFEQTRDIKRQNNEHISETSEKIAVDQCPSIDRTVSEPNELRPSPCSQTNDYSGELLEVRPEPEETVVPIKKPGSSRNRSAQMRRKSDRFATNLRNEIQRRKAQLQKSKGSSFLTCSEEPVEEREETVECQYRPGPPPPPPPKNKARLLEIKRANAECCTKPMDCSNPDTKQSEAIKKNIGSQKANWVERNDSVKETSEDDQIRLTSQNKAHNISQSLSDISQTYSKSNSVESHQESQDCDAKLVENQRGTACEFAPSNENTVQNASMKISLGSCRRLSSFKSSSPDIHASEKVDIEEYRDLSHPDAKTSNEVWRIGSSRNTSNTEFLKEVFVKHSSEDIDCSENFKSLGTEIKLSGMAHTKEQFFGEKCKLNHMENKGQNQSVHKINQNETGEGDAFSSVYAMQRKASNQPSDLEDFISQHKNYGTKWSFSPEHKLHPPLSERSPDVNAINMEGVAPPTTYMTEENILLPFADRRRFFEAGSIEPASSQVFTHIKGNKNNCCPNLPDYSLPQAVIPDLRRHSVDHTFHASSPSRQDSSLPFSEYCTMNHAVDPPLCCNQGNHSTDYLHSMVYGCRACILCCNDLYPTLHKRNVPIAHRSCHCQHHHHHHHQWTRCSDCLCSNQHSPLEDGTSMHNDPWHLRKPLVQDVPLKELNQQPNVNRKYSQSVSELCHYNHNSGFHHPGQFRPCGESNEWPHCYKAASTYDLSCDHPFKPVDLTSFQEAPQEPGLSRGRAYSVNQLNLEFLALRDRQEPPLAKLERKESSAPSKKKGPPRPPPPNWEKCRERRASQTTKSKLISYKEKSCDSNKIVEDVRQRSQSLPMDRTFLNVTHHFPAVHGNNHGVGYVPQGPHSLSSGGSPIQLPLIDCQRTPTYSSPDRNLGHNLSNDSEHVSGETNSADYTFCLDASNIKPLSNDKQEQKHNSILEDDFEVGYQNHEDDWSTDRESEISIPERYEFQPISPPAVCGAVSPTTCATYYNTSAAKAELLNKMKEMPGVQEELGDTPGAKEEDDELTHKKMQLIESISRKLSVLHEAQQGLQEDIHANSTLGFELENLLKNVCKPNEYDKFRTFIGDLDKVVNLLLSLSGRLSRVESALSCEDPEPSMDEKLNLLEKKKQLTDQLEDAKELKDHVTWREQVVLEAVSKYLNEEQLQDYHHYVKMTSALILEQRELEDKIRLGEEQLRCLRESL